MLMLYIRGIYKAVPTSYISEIVQNYEKLRILIPIPLKE